MEDFKNIKIPVIKSKSSYFRYYIIGEPMGGYGEKENHANNFVSIANGIDRGNGYQGYTAISYFINQKSVSEEAKQIVIDFCKKHNLIFD